MPPPALIAAGPWSADLLLALIQKDMKVRYKSSWLGYAWSVANPLAFAFVYYVAFGIFMRMEVPGYPFSLFLVAGLFPWQWLGTSVNAGPGTFVGNASLIKKVRFPRHTIVASAVLSDGIHFLVSIPVIALFLLIHGFQPGWPWLVGIPLLSIPLFLLTYGMALAVASLNLFFRDLERLVPIAVTFLFFFTPIIYPASAIPAEYQALVLWLNPVAPIIRAWQDLFLANQLDPALVLAAYAYGVLFMLLGWLVYRRLAPSFAELV
jgi:lipopolysaccharide transport system permease protein